MSEITIKITKNGELPGTVGWLAAHAKEIHLGTTVEDRRAAWLVDGARMEQLAVADGQQMMRLVNSINDEDYPDDYEILSRYSYTAAAWKVVEQLVEIAVENLREPAALAHAYEVTVTPKSPLLHAMLKAAGDDPAVRPAVIDYVENGGD